MGAFLFEEAGRVTARSRRQFLLAVTVKNLLAVFSSICRAFSDFPEESQNGWHLGRRKHFRE
jgi:hypothetical protein